MSRAGKRGEQQAVAAELRRRGASVAETAAVLRTRYGLDARLAARTARGWSQAQAATEWSRRWPEDPKTFKNISYWENWPSPTGHAPSLPVLDRLAALYGCDVADLVAGWGEHSPPRSADPIAERETLLWQVEHLDLPELTRAVTDWVGEETNDRQRALLLKLSTAAAVGGADPGGLIHGTSRVDVGPIRLAGSWTSTYTYPSTSRGAVFTGQHTVDLVVENGRLTGRSQQHPESSVLQVDLMVDGVVVTGTWTERTSPTGHYRAATYGGVIHLVVDPTGRAMTGMWLGLGKRYTIKSGEWRWERLTDPAAGR